MVNVSEIWRFPVKSVRGEALTTVDFDQNGLAFDRGWSILDHSSGKNLTGRRAPELLMASARVVEGEVVITLPDGTETNNDAALSTWLGRDVSLIRATDEGVASYEIPLDFENDADWVSWTGPGGAFHDSPKRRISLVSSATLGNWEADRFRTNLIIDGVEARAEDKWLNRTISIGESDFEVTKLIDRCVMVTRPQPGIDRNLDVLREINAKHDRCLAIGMLPTGQSTISVGDSVLF